MERRGICKASRTSAELVQLTALSIDDTAGRKHVNYYLPKRESACLSDQQCKYSAFRNPRISRFQSVGEAGGLFIVLASKSLTGPLLVRLSPRSGKIMEG